MKASRYSVLLAALLLATSILHADILVLKNGQRLEGETLQESPQAIRFRYNLTPKIKDEKDFPRSDVDQLIRQRPEELGIIEVRKKLPTPDLMTADEYERMIQDFFRPFVNKFTGTPQAAEVEKMIAEVTAEKERVVNGELKIDGKWLDAATVKRDAYNIDAYRLLVTYRKLVASTKMEEWVEALRIYDRIVDVQKGYPASIHVPKLYGEVQDLLKKYEDVLKKMATEQPILQQQREDNLTRLIEPDLSRTKAAIQGDDDRWKTVYEAEKRARIRWLMPYKYDLRSIQDAQKTVVGELTKLGAVDTSSLGALNEQLTAALRFIQDENVAEAEASLDNAMKLLGTNSKDYSRVLTDVRSRLQAKKSELAKRKASQRTTATGPTALGSADNAPAVDERVAAAMAAAKKGSDKPAEDADKGDAKADAKADAKKGAGKAAAPKAESKTAAPKSSTPASPAPVAEEEGFPKIFLVAAVALLAILIIALVSQKKKKASRDD